MPRVVAVPLVVALVCGVASYPLLSGLPKGHDWLYELVRIAELREAIRAGQFPPSWAGNLYGGYGSPFFLFYAPLFYLGSAAAHSVTGAVIPSMILTLVMFTLLSALTISIAGREVSHARPEERAIAARISLYLYVLNPYLLCDKFLRNSNAEFAGLSLLPLVPFGVLLIARDPARGLLATSMGLALVTSTHNITALSAAAIALGLALVLYLPRPSKQVVLSVGSGIALGLVMSAFFWVPAFWLLPEVRGKELLSGKFDFHNQFTHLADVFAYEHFYATGLLPLAVLLCVLGALARSRRDGSFDRRILLACLVLAGVLAFLMTQPSVLVWENFPLLAFFEFPWRFLGPFALVIALGGGLAFARLTTTLSSRTKSLLEVGVLAACLLNALPALDKVESLPRVEWTRFERLIAPASIQQRGLKATVYSEFMPRPSVRDVWRTTKPVVGPLLSVPPEVGIVVERNDPIEVRLEIDAPVAVDLQLARWLFPGWKATLNGEPLALRRSQLGTIAFAVPAGRHHLHGYFDDPPIRKAANWISLAGLICWIGLFVRRVMRPTGVGRRYDGASPVASIRSRNSSTGKSGGGSGSAPSRRSSRSAC